MLNRLGAAAMLAAAVASNFQGGDAPLSKNLRAAYKDELARLEAGAYDNLFRPAAVTMETGPAFAGGDMTDCEGRPQKTVFWVGAGVLSMFFMTIDVAGGKTALVPEGAAIDSRNRRYSRTIRAGWCRPSSTRRLRRTRRR